MRYAFDRSKDILESFGQNLVPNHVGYFFFSSLTWVSGPACAHLN